MSSYTYKNMECGTTNEVVSTEMNKYMRIEALEKHALAQEIKINTLEKLVNDLIMSAGYSLHSGPSKDFNEHHSPEQRLDWVRCMNLQEIRLSLFEKEAPCYAEMVQRIRNHQPCRGATTLTTFQHKVLQEADDAKKQKTIEEEKDKAYKDMMARVALLEEIADMFEDSDEDEEAAVVEQLRVREAEAVLRAAKAKLRGTPRTDGNCDIKICNDWSQVVADKFESQEKEIDYLKKNALAQEIKINELSKLVDQLIVGRENPTNSNEQKRAWNEIMIEGNGRDEQQNNDIIAREGEGLRSVFWGLNSRRSDILEAKIKENREKERKASLERVMRQVEAQEKLKAAELAEKKEKAMKDMMARVVLLEETAKKEEDELENLKLINEPKTDEEIEDPEIKELLIREANALARAAEMRAEKAKLRGTQKNSKPASGDPSTWSKEKSERISQMWCE